VLLPVGRDSERRPGVGSGTINVNPTAIVTSADVGNGLDVVVRVSPTEYWEISADPAPAWPRRTTPPTRGNPISEADSLVEGTSVPVRAVWP